MRNKNILLSLRRKKVPPSTYGTNHRLIYNMKHPTQPSIAHKSCLSCLFVISKSYLSSPSTMHRSYLPYVCTVHCIVPALTWW